MLGYPIVVATLVALVASQDGEPDYFWSDCNVVSFNGFPTLAVGVCSRAYLAGIDNEVSFTVFCDGGNATQLIFLESSDCDFESIDWDTFDNIMVNQLGEDGTDDITCQDGRDHCAYSLVRKHNNAGFNATCTDCDPDEDGPCDYWVDLPIIEDSCVDVYWSDDDFWMSYELVCGEDGIMQDRYWGQGCNDYSDNSTVVFPSSGCDTEEDEYTTVYECAGRMVETDCAAAYMDQLPIIKLDQCMEASIAEMGGEVSWKYVCNDDDEAEFRMYSARKCKENDFFGINEDIDFGTYVNCDGDTSCDFAVARSYNNVTCEDCEDDVEDCEDEHDWWEIPFIVNECLDIDWYYRHYESQIRGPIESAEFRCTDSDDSNEDPNAGDFENGIFFALFEDDDCKWKDLYNTSIMIDNDDVCGDSSDSDDDGDDFMELRSCPDRTTTNSPSGVDGLLVFVNVVFVSIFMLIGS